MYIRGKKISDTSAMHYIKLILRSLLFIACTLIYIFGRIHGFDGIDAIVKEVPVVLDAVAAIFVVEMALRFFPSAIESKGCQKQFGFNFESTGTNEEPKIDSQIKTVKVIISWVALNAVIAALYYTHIIDQGILVLICIAYSVCDMICILFFCPFQTWMMKNKCCGTCRIYNWDFIMMFTPCIMIDYPIAKVLFMFSLALLIEWEYLYHKFPERFAENTNAFLRCENCTEKLCSHKKQLQRYLIDFRKHLDDEKQKLEGKLSDEKTAIAGKISDGKEKLKEKIDDINSDIKH